MSPKVVIAATFSASPMAAPLRFWIRQLGLAHELEMAPVGRVFDELVDPNSQMARNNEGINVIVLNLRDWSGPATDIRRAGADFKAAVEAFTARSSASLIVCPIVMPGDASDGLRDTEASLVADLAGHASIHVISAQDVLAKYPVERADNPVGAGEARVPFTRNFFVALSTTIARAVRMLCGRPYKVIVVDCDNTLWAGVVAEEGVAAIGMTDSHLALQRALLRAHDSGVLLCLCSRNREEDVNAVFDGRKEMLLRPRHFAARRINWQPKAENLMALAAELGLGLDSFVFIDDDPFECAEVRRRCAEVVTIHFPRDPRLIGDLIRGAWIFDVDSRPSDDPERTALYAQHSQRQALLSALTYEDFLKQLELNVEIRAHREDEAPRVVQLSKRVNQFTFTGEPMEPGQLKMMCAAGCSCLIARVSDRFGDYGLVGAAIYRLEPDRLDLLGMMLSCRALNRGVEHQLMARLGGIAEAAGIDRVDIRFRSTARNEPAQIFMAELAVRPTGAADASVCYSVPVRKLVDLRFAGSSAVQAPAQQTAEVTAGTGESSVARTMMRTADELATVGSISEAIYGPAQMLASLNPSRSSFEDRVAKLWMQVFRCDQIDRALDFFEAGGHSLMALDLLSEIEREFAVEIPFEDFLTSKLTVEGMSETIGRFNSPGFAG